MTDAQTVSSMMIPFVEAPEIQIDQSLIAQHEKDTWIVGLEGWF